MGDSNFLGKEFALQRELAAGSPARIQTWGTLFPRTRQRHPSHRRVQRRLITAPKPP